ARRCPTSPRWFRRAFATISHAWPTCVPQRWTSSSTTWGPRRDAHRRPHRRDAAYRADRLSRVHLLAVAYRTVDRQAALDPRHRGGVGRVGDGLLRRRLTAARFDAVRAV